MLIVVLIEHGNGGAEKPATLQKLGRARDSWDNYSARVKAPGALVWGTKAQVWPRHVHAEGRRESRIATRHGFQTVPGSSQKPEDKVNSVCHEFQTNHQRRNEHAMKSHTLSINRGVHGASGERSCKTAFSATSGKCESP